MLEYRASQYFPDLVRDGIDAAVCIYHEIGDSTSISHKLGTVVAVLYASPDYVASCGAPDHPDGLVHHGCLSLENQSFGTRCVLTDGATTVVATLPGPLVGETPEVLLQAAVSGPGVAVLPAHVANRFPSAGTSRSRASRVAECRLWSLCPDVLSTIPRPEGPCLG